MKKLLNIPGHKGNTIKTTLRFHLTPVRMAIIKNTANAGKDAVEEEIELLVGM
jgi:hypothetical protein